MHGGKNCVFQQHKLRGYWTEFHQIWKTGTDPSSVHQVLSYGEKIAKIGPVNPEIIDKICQFFGRVVPDVRK